MSTRGYQSPMRVVVDQSSLRRLAILRLPGLPASRDFPDDRRWPRTRFLGFVRGAQICMASGERDMIAASTGWLSRSVLDVVSRCLPLRAVQCQAYTLQQGSTARAFCHHTRWTVRVISPRRAWAGISLGNCRRKSSFLRQPANLSPRLGRHIILTANLYSIITI